MTTEDVRQEIGDLPRTKDEVIGMLKDTQRRLDTARTQLEAAIRARGDNT